GTFGAMYLLGYSLNNLSLMALTIATGFVVDDAIVVTENVSRFIENGESPLRAALKGASQIGFTIVSITVSLLAVFIPILLMGGLVGRLFREFAVTLSVAIAISALVSLTLTPMMASRLLRPVQERRHGRVYRASERIFTGLHDAYDRALRWVLDHRFLMLLVTLVTVAFTIYLYIVIPKGLFPQQDTGSLSGFSEAPQDISFPAMKERQEALLKVLAEDPNIDHFISFINQGNTGNVEVDRDSAARLGITPQLIDDTLYDAFGQRQVATIYTQLNQYRVVLEVKPEFQASPAALQKLYLRADSGQQVPLGALAKVTQSQTVLSVNHQGQFPAVTLSFNVAPGIALGQAVNAINKATRDIGLPASARGSFQGTAQAFLQSLASEPFLIAFALIAVYIVLGVLYESYVHPITILSTLPSAGVGALLALL